MPVSTGHFVGCDHEDAKAKAAGWNLAFGLDVYRTCQPHVIAPIRISPAVLPQYTADALRAKIDGTVIVAAVVNADGSVGEVRVLKSLDKVYGLDEAAVNAARQTQFTPGRRGAKTVPVAVILDYQFTVR